MDHSGEQVVISPVDVNHAASGRWQVIGPQGPSGHPALEEVARLLAAGADPNEPDELGETPIFEAQLVGSPAP